MRVNYYQPYLETGLYHIYNKVGSGLVLFPQKTDYSHFLEKFKKYFSDYFDVLAYCLIPNHFHFLVKVKKVDDLLKLTIQREDTRMSRDFLLGHVEYTRFISDQFRRFTSGIALRHRHLYTREGALFLDRCKRIQIKSDIRLAYMLCYIHHNPIHHGLSKSYDKWKYSSYKSYFSDDNPYVNNQIIFDWLDKDRIESIQKLIKLHREFKIDMNNDDHIED